MRASWLLVIMFCVSSALAQQAPGGSGAWAPIQEDEQIEIRSLIVRAYAQWASENQQVVLFIPYTYVPRDTSAQYRQAGSVVAMLSLKPHCFYRPEVWLDRYSTGEPRRPRREAVVTHFLPTWWIVRRSSEWGRSSFSVVPSTQYFVNYQFDPRQVVDGQSGRVTVLTRQSGEALDVMRAGMSEPLPFCAEEVGTPARYLDFLRR